MMFPMFGGIFSSTVLDHFPEGGLLWIGNTKISLEDRERLMKTSAYLKMLYATGPRMVVMKFKLLRSHLNRNNSVKHAVM